jgi:hypothetical protein
MDKTQVKGTPTACSEAMRIGLSLVESVASRKFSTQAAAARSMGLSAEMGHRYRVLARLDEDLQQQVLAGGVDRHTVTRLLQVASVADKEAQRLAFAELMRQEPKTGSLLQSTASSRSKPGEKRSVPKHVRCVAYFNPEIFARQRWLAEGKVREVHRCVRGLNERLANTRSRLTLKGATRVVEDKLRHHDMLNVFEVNNETIQTETGSSVQLRLALDEKQWQRRRNFDGFTVLVAHPNVPGSAAELCQTYRAKNAVEADFEVIKSVVKLRPVRHRTDVKVRAHVALCMLALYVQRELTAKLKKEGISAGLAFEHLEPCRLSLYAGRDAGGDAYVLPQVDRQEMGILRRLGLTRLVDQRELAAALTPRSEFASTSEDEVP